MKIKDINFQPANEGRIYMAIVPHGWGRDRDARKALDIAMANGAWKRGSTKVPFELWEGPSSLGLDRSGNNLTWDGPADPKPSRVHEGEVELPRKYLSRGF